MRLSNILMNYKSTAIYEDCDKNLSYVKFRALEKDTDIVVNLKEDKYCFSDDDLLFVLMHKDIYTWHDFNEEEDYV